MTPTFAHAMTSLLSGGVDIWSAAMWVDNAPCVGMTDIFFPEEENEETVAPARLICQSCSNRLACIDASLCEEFGVWGGLASWERRPLQIQLSREFRRLLPGLTPTINTMARELSESMQSVMV